MRPIVDTPKWLAIIFRVVFWMLVGAGALVVAYFLMLVIAVVGFEIGLWGPPFGGE